MLFYGIKLFKVTFFLYILAIITRFLANICLIILVFPNFLYALICKKYIKSNQIMRSTTPKHIFSFLDLLNTSFMASSNEAMLLGDILFSYAK